MIYRIDNILDNKFRKSVLERSKKYLKSQEEFNVDVVLPGKQTPPDLHMKLDYGPSLLTAIRKAIDINFTIRRSWVNWTNGDKKDICWHTHPEADYSAVWYLKTPLPFFSNGTLFKDGLFKSPQNSVIIFPANIIHTAPPSPLRLDRYTLGMDLMRR